MINVYLCNAVVDGCNNLERFVHLVSTEQRHHSLILVWYPIQSKFPKISLVLFILFNPLSANVKVDFLPLSIFSFYFYSGHVFTLGISCF